MHIPVIVPCFNSLFRIVFSGTPLLLQGRLSDFCGTRRDVWTDQKFSMDWLTGAEHGEGVSQSRTINDNPSNLQQPIHSLRETHQLVPVVPPSTRRKFQPSLIKHHQSFEIEMNSGTDGDFI